VVVLATTALIARCDRATAAAQYGVSLLSLTLLLLSIMIYIVIVMYTAVHRGTPDGLAQADKLMPDLLAR
jgi:hypothetical protein